MTTTLHKAAQQALEALDAFSWEQVDAARIALRAALAQQAEPDWQDLYLKEKQRADMWRDKYESVAGAEQRIYLQAEPVAVDVDALAQHIRLVDGNHNLGAGILAEKIVEFLIKLGIGKEQAEPVAWEPAFHGFMSADGTQVDLCFSPSAPRSDGTYATAYYTAPPKQAGPVDTDCHTQGICQRSGYGITQQAEPVHEPVAWVECNGDLVWNNRAAAIGRNLYTAPPKRKPLTEEEIGRLCDEVSWSPRQLVRAVERAHGIGRQTDPQIEDRLARHGITQQAEPVEPVAWAEAIIDDLHALHDTELIREVDSGDALIRLDAAIAAVEEAEQRHTPLPQQAPLMQEIARLHDRVKDLTLDVEFLSQPSQRKPLTEEEILAAVGWERAEMYMKLMPNFPVEEAKKETIKNARAIERKVRGEEK